MDHLHLLLPLSFYARALFLRPTFFNTPLALHILRQVYLYEGVGHAFMNGNPAPFATFEDRTATMGFPAFDPAQASLAWTRLFEFFAKNLK
jgi:dienelactone hydrolase